MVTRARQEVRSAFPSLLCIFAMRITVQLDPKIARTVTNGELPKKTCAELTELLDTLSVSLVPLHPGAEDDTLSSYFAVDVPDSKTAETLVKRLRPCRGIRAAYIKPVDALP
jgi:hypothetical protein